MRPSPASLRFYLSASEGREVRALAALDRVGISPTVVACAYDRANPVRGCVDCHRRVARRALQDQREAGPGLIVVFEDGVTPTPRYSPQALMDAARFLETPAGTEAGYISLYNLPVVLSSLMTRPRRVAPGSMVYIYEEDLMMSTVAQVYTSEFAEKLLRETPDDVPIDRWVHGVGKHRYAVYPAPFKRCPPSESLSLATPADNHHWGWLLRTVTHDPLAYTWIERTMFLGDDALLAFYLLSILGLFAAIGLLRAPVRL